ncbi:MAG: radical SAM protein [candidate division WOR-3 bacterium]|nr:MAG: radical SAM protein [candidate division WOR-3 bacterium]
MRINTDTLSIIPMIIRCRLARNDKASACPPVAITFSVTGMCQSECKTCHIGREFRKNAKEIKAKSLSLGEIEKTFQNLGRVYYLNISGGEPYLRRDLPEIVELAMQYLKPRIVHIPTNAFLPERIDAMTRTILETMSKYNHTIPLTVKPSIDGIGERHDEIRGLKGNFERLEETIKRLKVIEEEHPNFHLELGTVVSNYNVADLTEIEDWVHSQGVQSYRNEIAEQREEFFNIGENITPSDEVYKKLMVSFTKKIKKNLSTKRPLAKMTESMRLVYYDLALKILRERKQVIPCYAGISNIHLNYDGELWPCCVLGYAHSLGNLRDFRYDYYALYGSRKARKVRKYIRDGRCCCPLANQAYSNMLMNPRYLGKMFTNYLMFS